MTVEDAVLYFGEVHRPEKRDIGRCYIRQGCICFRANGVDVKGRVVVTQSDQMVAIRLDGEGKNKHGPLVDWAGDVRKKPNNDQPAIYLSRCGGTKGK
jgi:hypothetical protein